ncbi:MAG: hypothetical protein EA402_02890 [Planctomycetota bacterium]|nr:MAG: hypothetical protein EA402_02890 [Planctomycetota bacterium]
MLSIPYLVASYFQLIHPWDRPFQGDASMFSLTISAAYVHSALPALVLCAVAIASRRWREPFLALAAIAGAALLWNIYASYWQVWPGMPAESAAHMIQVCQLTTAIGICLALGLSIVLVGLWRQSSWPFRCGLLLLLAVMYPGLHRFIIWSQRTIQIIEELGG